MTLHWWLVNSLFGGSLERFEINTASGGERWQMRRTNPCEESSIHKCPSENPVGAVPLRLRWHPAVQHAKCASKPVVTLAGN